MPNPETPEKMVILPPEAQNQGPEKPRPEEWRGIVEAILFVAGDAVETGDMCRAMNLTPEELDKTLSDLAGEYDFERRGIRILRFGNHVQMATRPDYAPYVERLLQPVQRQSLSAAIMETLAVIAYKQPVTKGDVEQIRGVKCDYSIQSLMAKGLIEEQGRRETLGRPILYGTTDVFLRHFCISSLEDLPQIDFSALSAKLEAIKNGELPLPEEPASEAAESKEDG